MKSEDPRTTAGDPERVEGLGEPAADLPLRPRSLRTKLVVMALTATTVAVVAVLALTFAGVNSLLRARLDRQLETSLALLVDYLSQVPVPAGPPPGLEPRGECVTLVTDPSGRLLHYFGSQRTKVPAPSPDLLRTMAGDRSTRMLPGSNFLGIVGTLPNGNYVVGGVSTADYDQILWRTVLLVGVALLLVLGLLTLTLLFFSKRWLRPLNSVVVAAQRIAEGDLAHRVEVSRSTHEVHVLTRSLNTMLARVQDSFTSRQRAEDRLRQFVASAGHELRTPLAAISGYAQLAQLGALDKPDEFHAAMRRVHDETGRMTALIEELLMLAELGRGRPDENKPVDLGPLCRDAVHDERAAAPAWVFESEIDPDRRYVVIGDAFRLRQTVTNLLANVRMHTPPGTRAKLTLSSSGDQHVIDVVDNGPGIAPEARARVFERFFRANPVSSLGSGLGLNIVAELVHCHGGTISVLPTDEGCWFQVRLPAVAGDAAAPALVPWAPAPPDSAFPGQN